MKTEHKIVGVNFKNDETGVRRQDLLGFLYDDYWTECEEDEVKLELRAEPDNPYDKNAVAVYCVAPEGKPEGDPEDDDYDPRDPRGRLGFISADENVRIGEALRKGKVRTVTLSSMTCMRNAKVAAKVAIVIGVNRKKKPKEVVDSEGRVYTFD